MPELTCLHLEEPLARASLKQALMQPEDMRNRRRNRRQARGSVARMPNAPGPFFRPSFVGGLEGRGIGPTRQAVPSGSPAPADSLLHELSDPCFPAWAGRLKLGTGTLAGSQPTVVDFAGRLRWQDCGQSVSNTTWSASTPCRDRNARHRDGRWRRPPNCSGTASDHADISADSGLRRHGAGRKGRNEASSGMEARRIPRKGVPACIRLPIGSFGKGAERPRQADQAAGGTDGGRVSSSPCRGA